MAILYDSDGHPYGGLVEKPQDPEKQAELIEGDRQLMLLIEQKQKEHGMSFRKFGTGEVTETEQQGRQGPAPSGFDQMQHVVAGRQQDDEQPVEDEDTPQR